MKSQLSCFVGLVALTISTSCGRVESPPTKSVSDGGGGANQSITDQQGNASNPTPIERAALAKEALFQALSTRLVTAMSNGGPVKAIEVCSTLAPQLAADIGRQHGVTIGRTAIRLRNTNNVPPAWAEVLLKDAPKQPVIADIGEGRTGALYPIMLKVQCLTCHGPEETIAPDVRAELRRLYPSDQAIGFQEGDLRGWFWVEVPADRHE